MKGSLFALFCFLLSLKVEAQQDAVSISLENVEYPHSVKFISLTTEGQDLRMAYMDIKSAHPNGRAVMLFHGKNFGGYYWANVIKALSQKGYRVIVPDQIGFGKSSKPYIHYSFHLLARFNRQLLDSLGIEKTSVLGHSMGGMLATRFALMFPHRIEKLLLENPIGLEDYREFVPYVSTEEQYKTELKASAESIKRYYQSSYFPERKPEYDYLVQIAAGPAKSAEFPRYARVAAMTFTMIYEQPVVYEFSNLKVPTVIFNGRADKTIVGKALLSAGEQARHGQYSVLGRQTAEKIPGAKLVEFDGVGHIPHIQIPDKFLAALISNL